MVLDIHHLPFADKSFDYIDRSHVLEHVDDPARACAEIMRVGKAGYIETPTAMKDALFGWAEEIGHRWHVTRVGRRLVFCEDEAGQRRGLGSELWRRAVLSRLYHPFQDLYFPHQAEFNVCLEWEGGFEVSVIRLDTRIALVNNYFSERMGYADVCLARALSHLGHEVHVVASDGQPVLRPPGVSLQAYQPFLGPPTVPVGTTEVEGFKVHRRPHQHIHGRISALTAWCRPCASCARRSSRPSAPAASRRPSWRWPGRPSATASSRSCASTSRSSPRRPRHGQSWRNKVKTFG